MKRFSFILAALIALPAPSFGLTSIAVTRRKSADTIIPSIPAITFATGAVTNNGFDTPTMACGCAAEGAVIALGTPACDAATLPAEDGATGYYNLTVKAANIANERCVVYMTGAAGIDPVVVYINTAQYMSYLDITSMTATQPAVKLLGNTSGAGIVSTGGSTGNGVTVASGAAGVGLKIDGAGASGYGLQIGSGAANGMYVTGQTRAAYFVGVGASSPGMQIDGTGATSAPGLVINGSGTGNGMTITSGNGAGADALALTSAGTGTSAYALVATSGAADAVALVPATGKVGINCGSATCFYSTGSVLSNRRE